MRVMTKVVAGMAAGSGACGWLVPGAGARRPRVGRTPSPSRRSRWTQTRWCAGSATPTSRCACSPRRRCGPWANRRCRRCARLPNTAGCRGAVARQAPRAPDRARRRPGAAEARRGAAERSRVDPDRPGLPPRPDMRHRFDDLFRQLERDFGVDIPRHRFFEDDFFQDLRGQMDAMQQQMQKALQGGGGQSQGMQMQVGPDGVKVEIKTRNDKGEEEVKTYAAPDLETFERKYPGVLEQNGLGGGFRLWTGNGPGMGQLRPMLRWRGGQLLPFPPQPQQDDDRDADVLPPVDVAPPPADRRLGVLIKNEIPPDLRDYLGLEPGQGLMVEAVQDGTLARQLGVAAGDIVLRIGKHGIGSAGDVQAALAGIDAGGQVEVEVLRKGRSLTLTGTKPAAEPEPKQLKPRPAK